MHFLAIVAGLVGSSSAYSFCGNSAFPYVGRNITLNWLPAAGQNPFTNLTVSVTGTVSVVDQCTFGVSNFGYTGASSIQFYGSYAGAPNGVLLSNAVIPQSSNLISSNYTFVGTPGNWVSYNDFNQFFVFDVAHSFVIATAVIPNGYTPAGTPGATTAAVPAATTRTAVATTTPVTNGAISNKESAVAISIAYLLSLLAF